MHLPFLTAEPLVLFPTGNTNRHEARSAPEGPTSRVGFEGVEFRTVGSGTVLELVGMMAEVVVEGDFQQAFELSRKEEPLYDWKRDRKTTFPIITHAR